MEGDGVNQRLRSPRIITITLFLLETLGREEACARTFERQVLVVGVCRVVALERKPVSLRYVSALKARVIDGH
jgi:hypothetical protein